ncbi:hypothetical protein [Limosilactobacillus fermentum]|uniref:hypothetical protein n=1 Tax=Limosilactobacillus fermentum TaxID=1613 RepID=UPI001E4BD9BB|nr:hypothetical protein [Limosilactobacillus fermentum]MCD5422949.1 hypothetical protein [Limosilactobacillus fermentum]
MYWNKKDNSIVEHCSNPFSPETSYDATVLNSAEVKAVQMVIEDFCRSCAKSKDDIHQGLWKADHKEDKEPRQDDSANTKFHEVVFIAKYTIQDDYGLMQEFDVFSNEDDAWNFVLDKSNNEGVTNISVMPRIVDVQLKREKYGDESED